MPVKTALLAALLLALPLVGRAEVPDIGDTLSARMSDVAVWCHVDGTLAVETPLELLSPAYRTRVAVGSSSSLYDGLSGATSMLLLSRDGRIMSLVVQGPWTPPQISAVSQALPGTDEAFWKALEAVRPTTPERIEKWRGELRDGGIYLR